MILLLKLIWVLGTDRAWAKTEINQARVFVQPHFELKPEILPESVHLNQLGSNQFRVLIYPHWGAYSVPQGREPSSALRSVRVSTLGECQEFKARLDSENQWHPSGASLRKFKETVLVPPREAGIPGAYYYQCTSAFKVHRPAPLQSYEYAGNFVLLQESGKIRLINLVDPDTYLKGVIPNEVPSHWPREVLNAQAVAARTYAWFGVLLARTRFSLFDLEDTVSDQAYLGLSRRTASTDQASEDTRGQILTFGDQPIKAYFSADSGGHTESALDAFGTFLAYCPAQKEQFDVSQMERPTGWSRTFTLPQLQQLFRDGRAGVGRVIPQAVQLKQIRILGRTPSGRVERIEFLTSDKKRRTLSGNDFRYVTKIRSTLFQLTPSPNGFQFDGAGFGHGVGMSQWGAYEHHRQMGWGYEQILSFYYPGTRLEVR